MGTCRIPNWLTRSDLCTSLFLTPWTANNLLKASPSDRTTHRLKKSWTLYTLNSDNPSDTGPFLIPPTTTSLGHSVRLSPVVFTYVLFPSFALASLVPRPSGQTLDCGSWNPDRTFTPGPGGRSRRGVMPTWYKIRHFVLTVRQRTHERN